LRQTRPIQKQLRFSAAIVNINTLRLRKCVCRLIEVVFLNLLRYRLLNTAGAFSQVLGLDSNVDLLRDRVRLRHDIRRRSSSLMILFAIVYACLWWVPAAADPQEVPHASQPQYFVTDIV